MRTPVCIRCDAPMDKRKVPVPGESKYVELYLCLVCYCTIPKAEEAIPDYDPLEYRDVR